MLLLLLQVDKEGCCLVVTTGGTGPAPRDVTPEATAAVCTRMMPGWVGRSCLDLFALTWAVTQSRETEPLLLVESYHLLMGWAQLLPHQPVRISSYISSQVRRADARHQPEVRPDCRALTTDCRHPRSISGHQSSRCEHSGAKTSNLQRCGGAEAEAQGCQDQQPKLEKCMPV